MNYTENQSKKHPKIAKKDATAIPNVASRPKCFKKLNEFPTVVFYSLAFTGYKMEINWDIATVTVK